ncbi:Lsr2 family DNA-binding protein [Micromonospora sediminicola]|uniref:Lsr2 family DNA-binding protein n=1 Tax=Micromonospora sediminicola TaxID=946078 RepID=UPI003792019A
MNDETNQAQTPATPKEVRAWAAENFRGTVGARGRIASDVKDAFTAATGRQTA